MDVWSLALIVFIAAGFVYAGWRGLPLSWSRRSPPSSQNDAVLTHARTLAQAIVSTGGEVGGVEFHDHERGLMVRVEAYAVPFTFPPDHDETQCHGLTTKAEA